MVVARAQPLTVDFGFRSYPGASGRKQSASDERTLMRSMVHVRPVLLRARDARGFLFLAGRFSSGDHPPLFRREAARIAKIIPPSHPDCETLHTLQILFLSVEVFGPLRRILRSEGNDVYFAVISF